MMLEVCVPLTWTDVDCSIYALYERNKKLGFALLLFILAQLAVSFWIDILPSVARSRSLLLEIMTKTTLIIITVSTFGPLGYPELDNVPTMRCEFIFLQASSPTDFIRNGNFSLFDSSIKQTVSLKVEASPRIKLC